MPIHLFNGCLEDVAWIVRLNRGMGEDNRHTMLREAQETLQRDRLDSDLGPLWL